jgi:hypothetical protein
VSPANQHTRHASEVRSSSPALRELAALGVALTTALVVFLALIPELRIQSPDLNDSALHQALAVRADESLSRSESALDFWFADVGLGFPVFHHYQPLPHLTLVVVSRLLGRTVAIATIYRWSIGVLLALLPLSMYGAMRRMGFDPLTSAATALLTPLVSAPALYGLGFESYLWAGSGLYAQLFASVLAPLAFAESYRAVTSGRRLALAALLVAATFLSQLVYGYIVALSTVAFIVPAVDRSRRAVRLALLLVTAFAAAAWFFVPALRDAAFANHSVWEDPTKWDSLGARNVVTYLVRGDLFDYRRQVPIVTLLVVIGIVCAFLHRHERPLILASLGIGWLVLYFGRPTWGLLIDGLPLAREIPLHRFIGGVQLFAIPLAAVGFAFVLRLLRPGRSRARMILAAAVAVVLLAPAARERAAYVRWSAGLKADSKRAFDRDRDLAPLLDQLQHLEGGRAYVGLPRFPDLNLKVGGVPLNALLLTHGIDSVGFLWHSMSLPGDVQLWFDPYDEAMCRAFGVRYVVMEAGRRPPPFSRTLVSIGRYRVHEIPGVSYFGLADVPIAVDAPAHRLYDVGLAWLRHGLGSVDLYPALTLGHQQPADIPVLPFDLLEPDRLDSAIPRHPSGPGEIARIFDRWAVEVTLERPAAAILRVSFHPGLQATVDGQPARPFPVTPGFAAVQVPKGRHVVRFTYVPALHWPLIIVGVLALVSIRPIADGLAERAAPLPPLVRWSPLATRVAIVIALAIVAGRPLLQTRELAGHDAVEYVTQLGEFDHALRDGQIPPRWAPDFDFGRGTPFFVFGPPVFLWVAEGFHLIGFGLIASTNLAALAFLISAAVLMFAFVRDRWGDTAGLVAASAYVLSPYVMLDAYVRHAFLEMAALPWLPLAALGVSRGAVGTVSLAVGLLILSHPALFPFTAVALLVYAIGRGTLRESLMGIGVGVGLAAWFILPALAQSRYLTVSETVAGPAFNYANHFATLGQLLWSRWGFGLSVPGPDDGMSFRIGLLQLAGIVGVLTWARGRRAWSLAAMAGVGVFFSVALSKPVWDALPAVHAISFPWRALAIAAFGASAAAGVAFKRLPLTATALALTLGLPLVGPQSYLPDVVNEQFTPSRIARQNLRPGTPGYFDVRGVLATPWTAVRAHPIAGDARVESWTARTDRLQATVDASTSARIQLEVADFPGWVATVDSRPVPIVPNDGRIAVTVEPGRHLIEARFERTAVDRWGLMISAVALIGLAISLVAANRRTVRQAAQTT